LSLLPDFWKGSKLKLNATTDGQDCTTFTDGACSMRIVGDGNGKKIKQQVIVTGSGGDSLTLTFDSMGDTVPVSGGKYRVQVKVFYTNGTKGSFKLDLPGGDNAWTPYVVNFSPTRAYNKIELRFMYSRSSGTVWFDNVVVAKN
jgi:hypothetical protein